MSEQHAPEHTRALRARIEAREARVAVIGLGYVGLPLLATVIDAGFPAIGLDHDASKIERLARGESYLPHLGIDLTRFASGDDGVRLASSSEALDDADVVLICVPTPLREDRTPDLSAVEHACQEIAGACARHNRPMLVVLESTTYPGTTREVVSPIVCVRDGVFVAFSPEREDPGRTTHTTATIPKLVGGLDEASGALARAFYERVVEHVVPCASAEVAEAAKLVENIYRSVNIALVNELKVSLHAMGLDVWDVLDAAETKPFGFQRFDPGPGFGGHCVPIDPYYLSWKASEVGAPADFVQLAGEVNRRMPRFVVDRCEEALRARGTAFERARVLVLGLAYKPDIADVRESPSFELIALLRARGADAAYHDPHVPETWPGRRHDVGMRSIEWTAERLASFDAVIISTDHAWYDWRFVGEHARLIIDTRNAMRAVTETDEGVRTKTILS
ncbi:MAG: nucleotide sugar dehydrogenase [Planctomycetota bacterium]